MGGRVTWEEAGLGVTIVSTSAAGLWAPIYPCSIVDTHEEVEAPMEAKHDPSRPPSTRVTF